MIKAKKRKIYIQFIEYMVSGGVYFWVGYLSFALFYGIHTKNFTFEGLGWSLWWAKLGANIIGWTINFVMQRYWVFNNPSLKKHQTKVTGRYAIITLVDWGLDYLIVAGLKHLGLTPYLGQFVSSGFFTFWNYFWYRFWVFPVPMKRHKTRVTPARIIAHRSHGHSGYHKART